MVKEINVKGSNLKECRQSYPVFIELGNLKKLYSLIDTSLFDHNYLK